MSLSEQIIQDLKEAMKSGDEIRKNVLRMLKSQIRNKEIDTGSKLSEAEEMQILNSAVKTRKESIKLYKNGDRQDLVEQETRELEIVQSYLPKPLSAEELDKAVSQLISELNISSMKDMGRVMKEMMSRYQGKVDGKQVQEVVRNKLS